ncbi:hypothetical protein [Emergencia sp.]|uniref:hypothetical protein n=1 Tax=Emergencia sp. TaxID=1926557 RepID=UPI003AF16595
MSLVSRSPGGEGIKNIVSADGAILAPAIKAGNGNVTIDGGFGVATPHDVKKGVIFSSDNGLQQTGAYEFKVSNGYEVKGCHSVDDIEPYTFVEESTSALGHNGTCYCGGAWTRGNECVERLSDTLMIAAYPDSNLKGYVSAIFDTESGITSSNIGLGIDVGYGVGIIPASATTAYIIYAYNDFSLKTIKVTVNEAERTVTKGDTVTLYTGTYAEIPRMYNTIKAYKVDGYTDTYAVFMIGYDGIGVQVIFVKANEVGIQLVRSTYTISTRYSTFQGGYCNGIDYKDGKLAVCTGRGSSGRYYLDYFVVDCTPDNLNVATPTEISGINGECDIMIRDDGKIVLMVGESTALFYLLTYKDGVVTQSSGISPFSGDKFLGKNCYSMAPYEDGNNIVVAASLQKKGDTATKFYIALLSQSLSLVGIVLYITNNITGAKMCKTNDDRYYFFTYGYYSGSSYSTAMYKLSWLKIPLYQKAVNSILGISKTKISKKDAGTTIVLEK